MDPPLSTPPSPPPPHAPPQPEFSDEQTTPAPLPQKLRLMCSYGGHIIPRPHDKTLCYIGGETRIIVIPRNTNLTEFKTKLSKILSNKSFTMKYQLPNEDLDSLISLTTDDDFENMVEEYDRLNSSSSSKSSRLRLFVFPEKSEGSITSIESLLESSTKSEDWFLEALNGIGSFVSQTSVYSESSSSVNCLLGLDDVEQKHAPHAPAPRQQMERDGSDESLVAKEKKEFSESGNNNVQEVNSVPDSPLMDRNSSFGSGSSMPSMAILSPIRVHVEEKGGGGGLGIEEQFNQITLGGGGGGVAGSSPPAPIIGVVVTGVPIVGGEFGNRVVSDDERSDQGVPVGYRKVQQLQQQVQQPQPQPPQFQQRPAGFVDMPSPDSVSR